MLAVVTRQNCEDQTRGKCNCPRRHQFQRNDQTGSSDTYADTTRTRPRRVPVTLHHCDETKMPIPGQAREQKIRILLTSNRRAHYCLGSHLARLNPPIRGPSVRSGLVKAIALVGLSLWLLAEATDAARKQTMIITKRSEIRHSS